MNNRPVTFEIVGLRSADEAAPRLASYLRSGRYIMGGILDTSKEERSRTRIYYKTGFADSALEMAHRIPGNQEVLRGHEMNQSSQIKIILGKDILPLSRNSLPVSPNSQ